MKTIMIAFFCSYLFAITQIHALSVGDIGQAVKKFKIDQVAARTPQIFNVHDQSMLGLLGHHKARDYLKLKNAVSAKHVSMPEFDSSFKWDTCGDGDGLFNIKDFNVSPDPLRFPGVFYLQFNATMKQTVDGPLRVRLTVRKEIVDSFWLTIPCVDGLGSCQYDDLCEELQKVASCPSSFVKNDVPCKCPFTKGDYNVGKTGIHVNLKSFPAGNYYIKADLTHNYQPVTCIELFFSVAQNS